MRGIFKAQVVLLVVATTAFLPLPAVAASEFIAPVQGTPSRHFDLSNSQFGGGHDGVDYRVAPGTPVFASARGTVSSAHEASEGLNISIRHDDNVETTYSLGTTNVAVGQAVEQGQLIGLSGTGHDASPVLHFGARIGHENVDPMLLIEGLDDISYLLELDQTPIQAAPQEVFQGGPVLPPSLDLGPTFVPPAIEPPGPGGRNPAIGPETSPIETRATPQRRGPILPSKFLTAAEGEGGATGDLMFDGRTGLPLFNDPRPVEQWWTRLPPQEQERLINRQTIPIGHLVGVPVAVRDRANRLTLARRIKEMELEKVRRDELSDAAPLARLFSEYPIPLSRLSENLAEKYEGIIGLTPWHRRETAFNRELVGAQKLMQQLKAISTTQDYGLSEKDVYLLELDTTAAWGDGQAVVALGDPTTAAHIGLVVPGINNALHNIQGPLGNAADLRAAVIENDGIAAARRTSEIMWLGYDAPNGLLDAGNEAEAREGAPRLLKFVDGLRASHARPGIRPGYSDGRANRDPHITGFGHSYGSTVSGVATLLGMDVDDLLLFGSPGGGARFGAQLASIWRQIWVARTKDDIIKVATWAPVLGEDPMDPGFGGIPIPLDSTQQGHGGYYEPGSEGLRNFAYILTGRYEMVGRDSHD